MGYIDIIGAAIGFNQKDFSISESLAKLLPASVFIWFFLLSIPVSAFQKKYGIKPILNAGLVITGAAMFIPILKYSYGTMIISFVLLGIGNTILQVTINHMFQLVSSGNKYASNLSMSQFIKSISSLCGPLLTVWIANQFGFWRYTFIVFGLTSVLLAVWFYFLPSPTREINSDINSRKSPFALLKNRFVIFMVLGIFLIVRLDVGINTTIYNYFTTLFNFNTNEAISSISIYFLAKILGTFIGAILLQKIKPDIFFRIITILIVLFTFLFILSHSAFLSKIYLFLIGLFAANVFPIIFSLAIQKLPEYLEELSGLLY